MKPATLGKIFGMLGLLLLLTSPLTYFFITDNPWLLGGKALAGLLAIGAFFATNFNNLGQFASRKASQRFPERSKSSALGPFNGISPMDAPSDVGPRPPLPAKVLILPLLESILLTRLLPMSQTYRLSSESNWMLCGCFNWAEAAGPPSPEKPATPVPATVLIRPVRTSIRRTR